MNIFGINSEFESEKDQISEVEGRDFQFFIEYYHEMNFDPNLQGINDLYLEVFRHFEKEL